MKQMNENLCQEHMLRIYKQYVTPLVNRMISFEHHACFGFNKNDMAESFIV